MTGDSMFFSYVVPLLLCSVPLATALKAWHLSRSQTPDLPNLRIICFYCGVAISILTSLVTMTCMLDPFPVVRSPDGSASIPLLDLASQMAYGGAFLTIILALFGRGWSRILLAVSGAMLVLFFLGWALRNGI